MDTPGHTCGKKDPPVYDTMRVIQEIAELTAEFGNPQPLQELKRFQGEILYADYLREQDLRREAEAEITRLMNALEAAWGVIANVKGGNWELAPRKWREAALSFRDDHWHPALERNGYASTSESGLEKGVLSLVREITQKHVRAGALGSARHWPQAVVTCLPVEGRDAYRFQVRPYESAEPAGQITVSGHALYSLKSQEDVKLFVEYVASDLARTLKRSEGGVEL